MLTDFELAAKLREGKEYAYKELFNLHYTPLCLFAYQYVKDRFVAETIVSDVFYYLWRKREEIEIKQSIRSYLTKAVKNRSLNYLEEQENLAKLIIHVNDQREEQERSFEKDLNNPLVRLIEKELDLKIRESIEKLPPLTRKVFELSRFSNLKYIEIAEVTGLSVDAVKYHMKQALARLKEELSPYFLWALAIFSFFQEKNLF